MNFQDQKNDMSWLSYETTSEDLSNFKGKKRSRVSRACDICRRKKIKCELSNSPQCIACKQYGWECTFNVTAKKRGPPKGYIESLENRLKKMESLLQNLKPEKNIKEQLVANNNNNSSDGDETAVPISKKRPSPEDNKVVRYLGSSSGYYLVENMLSTEEIAAHRPNKAIKTDFADFRFRKINVVDNDILFVRNRTEAEEALRGEIDDYDEHPNLITKSMEKQLIRRYFQMQHTTLPVVDKKPFLDSYEGRTESPPGVLLVYAICAHTCTLLQKDDPIFEDADRQRDEVYATLMDYCSGLSRKEFLVPNISTIQSLILLCGFPNCSDTFYKNWIRAGMAVRMAQELGLHRALEKFPMPEEQFESRKRLWYCVYIIDRWICAVMGRPLAISEADCDIEMPHVNGGANGTGDYSLFNNFIRLSGILGELLRRIYSPRAKSTGYKTSATYHTVQGIHNLLKNWVRQVPDHHRISPEEAKMLYKNKIQTNKVREAGPLMVCYYATIILLYRTFIVSDKQDVHPKLLEEANICCTEAAKNAIDIARLINPADILCFGWSFAGFSIIQATLIHLYNCTNSSPEIARLSREYIEISIVECIEPLSLNTGITPQYVLPLIRTLLKLIGVDRRRRSSGIDGSKSRSSSLDSSDYTTDDNTTVGSTENISCSHKSMAADTVMKCLKVNRTHFNIPSDSNDQRLPIPQTTLKINPNMNTSSWNSKASPNNNPNSEQEILSAVAWKNLFCTAATPFFDAENDFQNILSTLFDENQARQFNTTFSNSMF